MRLPCRGCTLYDSCDSFCFDVLVRIAELHASFGQPSEAISLYQEAAYLAMDAGKMKAANTWSALAAELEELQLEWGWDRADNVHNSS